MKAPSKITIVRLIASGAIVGVALGNLVGLDLAGFIPFSHISFLSNDVLTGAIGAGGAAVALKLVHIL